MSGGTDMVEAESHKLNQDASTKMLTEHIFIANGVPLNYAVGPASGPPLLLLHGITERWQTFLPLIPRLSTRWQLYALDLRGHGRSGRIKNNYRIVDYAQDVICFLGSQIHQPCFILGHSVGALVAIYLAAHQPKQVKALILVDPPLHLQHTPLKDIPSGPYEIFKRILEIIRAHRSPQAIEQALAKCFPEGNLEAHRTRAEVLSQLDPDALDISLENHHLAGLDLYVLMPQIECPTLLIQGNPQRGAALFDEDVDQALAVLRYGFRTFIPEGGICCSILIPRPSWLP
jgi:pimeloyl-ACP methyl ester carboxylesterase